jgi:hypothetical protein
VEELDAWLAAPFVPDPVPRDDPAPLTDAEWSLDKLLEAARSSPSAELNLLATRCDALAELHMNAAVIAEGHALPIGTLH